VDLGAGNRVDFIDLDGSTCTDSLRIARGGDWYRSAQGCRSAKRHNGMPVRRSNGIGFRLVRTLHPTSCDPDPCNGNATSCSDDGGVVTCTCEEQYGGRYCNICAEGYSCYPDCIDSFQCENGVCIDPATCFEWQETPTGGTMEWGNAITHCQNLSLSGMGWRLPNISELRSLVRNCGPIEMGEACGVRLYIFTSLNIYIF